MRVLVCGGRDYDDVKAVYGELDALAREHGWLTVIEGGAKGADRLARTWARTRGPSSFDCSIDVVTFNANWREHGRAAGPIRNAQMLRDGMPDLVLAFPGGCGTLDMVEKARKAGIEVRIMQAGDE
jgi:predicted Rossmann-fold nucleotide-binding protein